MKTVFSFALVLMLAVSVSGFAGDKTLEIKVDGMTCNGCVDKVKTTLEKVDGVKSAEVSLESNSAVVLYNGSKTEEGKLKEAVNSTGFKAVDAEQVKEKKDKSDCGASSSCGDKTSETKA